MTIIDDWFNFALGEALDPDGHYGNQCVDAVDHYAEFIFGVPWQQCVGGVTGAKQLLDAAPDEYWIRIDYYHGFIPQRGDVTVFGGDQYNQWGHTAPTENATNTYIDVLQQDGFGAPLKNVDGGWYSDKPAHRARLAYSQNGTGPLKGVLRPRPEKLKAGGLQLNSASTTQDEDDDMGHVDTISDTAAEAIAAKLLAAQVQREGQPAGQTNTLGWSLGAEAPRTEGIIAHTAEAAVRGVLFTKFPRQGPGQTGETDLASVISWFDHGVQNAGSATPHDAPAIDPEQIKASISTAVSDALRSMDLTFTISQPAGQEPTA